MWHFGFSHGHQRNGKGEFHRSPHCHCRNSPAPFSLCVKEVQFDLVHCPFSLCGVAGKTMDQIELYLTDDYDNVVSTPHYVSVTLQQSSAPQASAANGTHASSSVQKISNVSDLLLTAARTVLAPNGTLNFTDFQVQRAGAKYGLLFTSTYAQKTANATSTQFNVHHAEVFAIRITRQPDKCLPSDLARHACLSRISPDTLLAYFRPTTKKQPCSPTAWFTNRLVHKPPCSPTA